MTILNRLPSRKSHCTDDEVFKKRVCENDFRAPNRYLQNEGKFYSFLDIKRKMPETVETKTDCKKCNAMDGAPPVIVRILN